MRVREKIAVPRRHIRAVGPPLACLVVIGAFWVAANVAVSHTAQPSAGRLPLVAHIISGVTLIGTVGWLLQRMRRADQQARQDEDARHMLDVLRLEAMEAGTVLLEIHEVQWTARSGQRVWAVEALTGAVSDRWLFGQALPPGSLVLVRERAGQPSSVVARMTPDELDRANRQRGVDVDRSTSLGRMVVEAAERLLD